MPELKLMTNSFPPKERLAFNRRLILDSIDKKLSELEKEAEKYPPGYLNRSEIDGEMKGLRYSRKVIETLLSTDILKMIYK